MAHISGMAEKKIRSVLAIYWTCNCIIVAYVVGLMSDIREVHVQLNLLQKVSLLTRCPLFTGILYFNIKIADVPIILHLFHRIPVILNLSNITYI